jgi:Response regulator containing CheY-like receiver domain and AraC-type DNA-binding domain
MNKIQQVLEDFYHSTGIEIKFWSHLDITTAVIAEPDLLSLERLREDIKGVKNLTTLTYHEHIHFIILPFEKEPNIKGCFVAGPFQSQSPSYEGNMVFKPFYCLIHFERLLDSITCHHLSTPVTFEPSILKGIEYIHAHYRNEIALDEICHHLGLNKCYFCSLFKHATQLTFSQFLNRVRVEASKHYLIHSSDSILEIALATGFNNHNYFSSTFKKIVKMSPIDFRNKYSKVTYYLKFGTKSRTII